MDAASSLVAVIGFALTSTKTLYEAFSSIRDGPQRIQQAVRGLQQLQIIFARLQNLQPGVARESSLYQLVAEYKRGLDTFQPLVRRMSALPNDSQGKRFWKRIKMIIRDKDIDRIQQFIQYHISALSTHLTILERFVVGKASVTR